MNIYPFGKIDPDNLNDYYHGVIQLNDLEIELDINFLEPNLEIRRTDPKKLENVQDFITNIVEYSKNVMKYIEEDYDSGNESADSRFYLNHHLDLDVMDETEILELFDTTDVTKEIYFSKLKIRRIGFYPEDPKNYVVVDVMFPPRITNYLLSVTFDDSFAMISIAMES